MSKITRLIKYIKRNKGDILLLIAIIIAMGFISYKIVESNNEIDKFRNEISKIENSSLISEILLPETTKEDIWLAGRIKDEVKLKEIVSKKDIVIENNDFDSLEIENFKTKFVKIINDQSMGSEIYDIQVLIKTKEDLRKLYYLKDNEYLILKFEDAKVNSNNLDHGKENNILENDKKINLEALPIRVILEYSIVEKNHYSDIIDPYLLEEYGD